MTTAYHTPHTFGDPLSAAELNGPLSQLDSGIGTIAAGLAGSSLAVTTTDASAGSGQAVVPVTATTNFVVGQTVFIGDPAGTFESRVILSIQAGVSLTMTANLTNTYASGTLVSASPSELVSARGAYATLDLRIAAGVGTVGTAMPASPAANDLVRRTDRANAVYYYTGAAWVQINTPNATAFWATPSTGDRVFRTDRSLEYVYDGTRWLTTTLYIGTLSYQRILNPVASPKASAVGYADGPTWNTLYSEYIVTFFMQSNVATTNNGTNYWTVRLGIPGATLGTLDTSADVNIDIWFQHLVAINAVAAAHNVKALTVQTTGTPGSLYVSAMYTYRLIG